MAAIQPAAVPLCEPGTLDVTALDKLTRGAANYETALTEFQRANPDAREIVLPHSLASELNEPSRKGLFLLCTRARPLAAGERPRSSGTGLVRRTTHEEEQGERAGVGTAASWTQPGAYVYLARWDDGRVVCSLDWALRELDVSEPVAAAPPVPAPPDAAESPEVVGRRWQLPDRAPRRDSLWRSRWPGPDEVLNLATFFAIADLEARRTGVPTYAALGVLENHALQHAGGVPWMRDSLSVSTHQLTAARLALRAWRGERQSDGALRELLSAAARSGPGPYYLLCAAFGQASFPAMIALACEADDVPPDYALTQARSTPAFRAVREKFLDLCSKALADENTVQGSQREPSGKASVALQAAAAAFGVPTLASRVPSDEFLACAADVYAYAFRNAVTTADATEKVWAALSKGAYLYATTAAALADAFLKPDVDCTVVGTVRNVFPTAGLRSLQSDSAPAKPGTLWGYLRAQLTDPALDVDQTCVPPFAGGGAADGAPFPGPTVRRVFRAFWLNRADVGREHAGVARALRGEQWLDLAATNALLGDALRGDEASSGVKRRVAASQCPDTAAWNRAELGTLSAQALARTAQNKPMGSLWKALGKRAAAATACGLYSSSDADALVVFADVRAETPGENCYAAPLVLVSRTAANAEAVFLADWYAPGATHKDAAPKYHPLLLAATDPRAQYARQLAASEFPVARRQHGQPAAKTLRSSPSPLAFVAWSAGSFDAPLLELLAEFRWVKPRALAEGTEDTRLARLGANLDVRPTVPSNDVVTHVPSTPAELAALLGVAAQNKELAVAKIVAAYEQARFTFTLAPELFAARDRQLAARYLRLCALVRAWSNSKADREYAAAARRAHAVLLGRPLADSEQDRDSGGSSGTVAKRGTPRVVALGALRKTRGLLSGPAACRIDRLMAVLRRRKSTGDLNVDEPECQEDFK